jgi:hypothetical protein
MDPICPKCKGKKILRVRRAGFLQAVFYPQLGLFPWKCEGCRNVFLFKSQGKLKRKRREQGEVHLPPIR